MKVYVLKTKTNFYVYYEGTYYCRIDGEIRPMTEEEKTTKTAWATEFKFWGEFEADSIDEAVQLWKEKEKKRQEARRKEFTEWETKYKQELQAKWNDLSKLDVIPTTLENLRTVANMLNQQNWGSWRLPKMSIGYSAHQYDCDGKIATTITLDEPIDGKTKFKVGGKRGHLSKYQTL